MSISNPVFKNLGASLLVWVSMINIAYPAVNIKKINMFVGDVKVLPNTSASRIAVGNGQLVRVRVLPGRQLLLIAEGAGSTSVHLWHRNGSESRLNIYISETDPEPRVRLERMIHMDVKIVEFRKQALDEIGVDWQKSTTGPFLAIAGDVISTSSFRSTPTSAIFEGLPSRVNPFDAHFGIMAEITSRLNFLVSNGDAFLLAEPRLSCRNGGECKFLAGGEIPLPIQNELGQTEVDFKEFGVILDISPIADASGIIATKITTEVSSIDPSITVNGIPGFLTRRTQSEVNVRAGETIVISGLISNEGSKDYTKIPILGDIPILGHLFKSKRFQNRESELVIFVTPRIITPASLLNQKAIQDAERGLKRRQKAVEKRMQFGIVD